MLAQIPRKPIRFQFSPEKARAGILLMLECPGDHDLHELLKACYFADKDHLNKYNTPIFGALYSAMKFGPVPVEIYGMLKGEPIWLAELGVDAFPWNLQGFHVKMRSNEGADLDVLSRSDIDALKSAHHLSSHMSFDQRTMATHGQDWQFGNMGIMRHEDMIEDGPDKQEKVAYLRETAPRLKL